MLRISSNTLLRTPAGLLTLAMVTATLLALASLTLMASVSSAQTSSIDYTDFSSANGLTLQRNAKIQNNALRLTSTGVSGYGTAWHNTPQDVADGFSTTFRFKISELSYGVGADGIGFHVHGGTLDQLASHHGDEITGKHLSVVFDTFANWESSDPSDNFVEIRYNDGQSRTSRVSLKNLNQLDPRIDLSDGRDHTAKIEYSDGTVAVSIDGKQVTSANNIDLGSVSPAKVGFGAFGGYYTENHDILSWSWNKDSVDTTPPVISGLPSSDITETATGASGADVDIPSITATDDVDQSVDVVCSSGSADVTPNSSQTFPLGETTVTCSATDDAGNKAEGSFKVKVTYAWTGVLQPINGGSTSDYSDDDSVFKLGSTVPVKFKLTGDSAGITDATARLYVSKVSSGVVGDEVEADSTAAATTGNLFRYDSTNDQYIFNWGTKGLETGAGTYKLRIDLGDETTNTVQVSLK